MKSAYKTIKTRHITEKATVLENLKNNASNKSVAKCDKPKYVFVVDSKATKADIKKAIETIYAGKKIKVMKVNTIWARPKPKRYRGKLGVKPGYKKAIVTLRPNDSIDEV